MATKKKPSGPLPEVLQIRIYRDDERTSALVSKLEKIAQVNKLSVNDVANLALSAGLNMVETKLAEIHEPSAKAA